VINGVFAIPLDESLGACKTPCSYRCVESRAITKQAGTKQAGEKSNCCGAPPSKLSAYIGGPENIATRVAAESVFAEQRHFNPLILTGPTATGKSLAALAITHGWMRRNRTATAFSITAADFVYQYRDACFTDSLTDFRRRFQKAVFICLEDIQDLAGKTEAQQELAALLDDALAENRWVVATRREPCAALCPALMSRLSGGLVVNLRCPDIAARRELLERLADYYEYSFSPSSLDELASELDTTFPTLKHAVLSLGQACSPGGIVGVEQARKYLEQEVQAKSPSLRSITSCVARYFKLRVADLRGSSRKQSVVRARAMAMFLCRTLTDASLSTIGKQFGNRDHTTVLHAYRKVSADDAQNQEIQHLTKKLLGK